MYYELSKSDKKIARRCIDKGLEAEFREGLENSDAIIQQWRSGEFETNKEAYHYLFQAVFAKDKAIARRYDGLTGSRWLMTVVHLLHEGYISENDIEYFSEESKAIIRKEIVLLRKD